MVLTVYFALSPVTGLFCHRRLRTDVVSAPGRADITSATLTPASGRQDHTTSPYAAIVSRPRAVDRSQIFRPALRSHCAQDAAASTASRPAFRDDHDTPLWWGGMARACRDDLPDGLSEIFLERGIDTPVNKPPDGQISGGAVTERASTRARQSWSAATSAPRTRSPCRRRASDKAPRHWAVRPRRRSAHP